MLYLNLGLWPAKPMLRTTKSQNNLKTHPFRETCPLVALGFPGVPLTNSAIAAHGRPPSGNLHPGSGTGAPGQGMARGGGPCSCTASRCSGSHTSEAGKEERFFTALPRGEKSPLLTCLKDKRSHKTHSEEKTLNFKKGKK